MPTAIPEKYSNISLAGLKRIGRGGKADVYRYDDDLVLKVYRNGTAPEEIERENALARTALIAGVPTAISFGSARTSDGRFGSLFEMIDSESLSEQIADDPAHVADYASVMADIARTIHRIDGSALGLPDGMVQIYRWIREGIGRADPELAGHYTAFIESVPRTATLIHGDLHAGNIMRQRKEYLLIDMDSLAVCHPIFELGALHLCYIAYGEIDPEEAEAFLGCSAKTASDFFEAFLRAYLKTCDESLLNRVRGAAALIGYMRAFYKAKTDAGRAHCLAEIRGILPEFSNLK